MLEVALSLSQLLKELVGLDPEGRYTGVAYNLTNPQQTVDRRHAVVGVHSLGNLGEP